MSQAVVYDIQRMSTRDGPGLRTTVFLKGCPLRCLWCSNPESQSFMPQLLVFENLCSGCGRCMEVCPAGAVERNGAACNRNLALCTDCGACVAECPAKARVMSGKLMDVAEVMDVVRKDALFYANSDGGVTFGGGEATAAGDFLLDMLRACRDEAFHVCVDTCGFCPPEYFSKVAGLTDLFLFDCKHMDAETHKRLTGQDNALILANLRAALASGVRTRIRVPLLPGLNDSEENIRAMALLLHEYDVYEVDVLPYHAFGRNKYAALRRDWPEFRAYEPERLRGALDRFAGHGLRAEIV
ncbi:MAG: glycyl-radical enzyme activating protein [Desulfovibrio sp.]|nr:glycyl-radical enzyme activating protein [Desulfovibrio sp.]